MRSFVDFIFLLGFGAFVSNENAQKRHLSSFSLWNSDSAVSLCEFHVFYELKRSYFTIFMAVFRKWVLSENGVLSWLPLIKIHVLCAVDAKFGFSGVFLSITYIFSVQTEYSFYGHFSKTVSNSNFVYDPGGANWNDFSKLKYRVDTAYSTLFYEDLKLDPKARLFF